MSELPFKISVLIFVKNKDGKHLLLQRNKNPNKGFWSPIGGKLEMTIGESPFECAIREIKEEINLDVCEDDLHLFSIVSEKAYEGNTHWLMFLFDCKKIIEKLPDNFDEGNFAFFDIDEIDNIKIPNTDKILLWDIWEKYHKCGQVIVSANCKNDEVDYKIQQIIN